MIVEAMSILVVDDSPDVHNQLKVFLCSEGMEHLHFADSVASAYALLGIGEEGESRKESVDLILMDINMGEIDGIEATRRIKAHPGLQEVPILMITGDTSQESLMSAFEAGAVDYITKPFNKVELVARVRSFLRLKAETDARKNREKELEMALSEIKTLKGFIPICASCKKIRQDDGYWLQIERYIATHSDVKFTHGICPECTEKLYPDMDSM